MSSRPIISPYPVVVNGDMTSTITSLVTVIQNISLVSYSVSWSGTPTGSFQVQVSNDYSQNASGQVNNPGTWSPLTLSGSPVASGSSGNGFIDVDGTGAYAIRLQYIPVSGSGILNAIVSGKSS